MSNSSPQKHVAIWDIATRLFHWSLVLLLAALWWTGEQRLLDWHRLAGYAVLELVVFRLIWGFAGSTTSRFAEFVRSPGAIVRYIQGSMFRRDAPPHAGHNPLGGWSVLVMLGVLACQVALGLFAVDVDGLESGPFSYLVEFETGRQAAKLHHLFFNALLILVVAHIAAVVFYLACRRDNLVATMISGRRAWHGEAPVLMRASASRAVIIFILSSAVVWGLIWAFGRA